MIEFGTITLYREKSVVHRFGPLAATEAEPAPELVITSNRVMIPIKTTVDNFNVVVRGQNVTGAMRMTSVVIDEFRRDENLLYDPGALDWESFWQRKISNYERDYNDDYWVSLHVNGALIYSSRDDDTPNPGFELERFAKGNEINEDIVLQAATKVLGNGDDLDVVGVQGANQNTAFVTGSDHTHTDGIVHLVAVAEVSGTQSAHRHGSGRDDAFQHVATRNADGFVVV